MSATVHYSDGVDVYDEKIANEMIEEVTPKIYMTGEVAANYTITAKSLDDNSALFINGVEEIIAEPSLQKIYYNLYLVKNSGLFVCLRVYLFTCLLV